MSNPNPTTELLLERYALDEVSPDEKRAVEAELARSHETRERLATLETSNREILGQYPAAQMAAAIRQRGERRPKRPWGLPVAALVPAAGLAAAALVVTLLPDEASNPPAVVSPPVEVTRDKGLIPTLFVHRQKEGGSERLGNGAWAAERDVLQLSYVALGRDHGAIVSIDGRGTVTLHHPHRVGGDTALLPAGEAALPNAYELDDAPAFERFFFVTTAQGSLLDTTVVLAAARELARDVARARVAPLPLPDEYEQSSVLVAKPGSQP